jgi:hypothetical protein
MNDTYVYLVLTLPFVALAAIIFILRPDLRRVILRVGLFGALLGLVLEFWYFRDYWQPPTLTGVAIQSIEDVLFGGAVTALAVTAYAFLTKQSLPRFGRSGLKRLGLLVIAAGIAMVILNNLLGINSILAGSIIMLSIGAAILTKRPDLWKKAAVTAGVLVGVALLTYAPLFGLISPEYLDRYFLLTGEWWNPSLFGFFPVAELQWYIVDGMVVGILYDYLSQRDKSLKRAA